MMKREQKQRERLWREATGHCLYCGHPVSLEEMEVDHIHPRSRGGGNGYGNKVCSCPGCNALKGDALLEDFLRDHFNETQYRKYLNRLETLVTQGKMPWEKYWELSAPEHEDEDFEAPEPLEAPAPPQGRLCLIGGILFLEC